MQYENLPKFEIHYLNDVILLNCRPIDNPKVISTINSFIERYPYFQISDVVYKNIKSGSGSEVFDELNIPTDIPFKLIRGCWFICSDKPLVLNFEEHNQLFSSAPYGNYRNKFNDWAKNTLDVTKSHCIGEVSDPDGWELGICFWPSKLDIIKKYLEPILRSKGLEIT